MKNPISRPFDMTPPPAPDAERALLCTMMMDGQAGATACAAAFDALDGPQDFGDPAHAALYETILELNTTGRPTDPVSVKEALRGRGMFNQVNGGEGGDYLAQVAEAVPSAASAPHYATLVRQAAARCHEALRLQKALVEVCQGGEWQDAPKREREAVIVRLSDVKAERIEWLWKDRLAVGKLHLLAGDPGLGKSTVALDIAARITTGAPFPFEDGVSRKPAGVVVLAAEDGLADTIRPRMDAAGVDAYRVVAVPAVRLRAKNGKTKEAGLTLADLDAIEQAAAQVENCALVLIDPLMAYLGDKDSHKDAEVRSLLAPLGQLAERLRVAVLIVAHLNKGDGRKAAYRVGGSVGIIASARIALGVAKDKEDSTLRLIAPIKANICKDTGALSYRLVDSDQPDHPRVEWVAEREGIDGESLLAQSSEDEGGQSLDDAMENALQLSGDAGMPFAQLQAVAQDVGGYGEKATRGALRRLGAIAKRKGFQGATHWHLPAKPVAQAVAQTPAGA